MNKIATENRGLSPGIFDKVRNNFVSHNSMQTLGIKITYLGKGIAGMTMRPESKFSTPGGRVHGGLIATLADTVMGAAAITLSGSAYRTVEINLNYLAPAFEEYELIGEASVIHPGNTIAVVAGSIYNNQKQLVAEGRGTFIKDKKYVS